MSCIAFVLILIQFILAWKHLVEFTAIWFIRVVPTSYSSIVYIGIILTAYFIRLIIISSLLITILDLSTCITTNFLEISLYIFFRINVAPLVLYLSLHIKRIYSYFWDVSKRRSVRFPGQPKGDLEWLPFFCQYHSTKVPIRFGHRRHCKMPKYNSFDILNTSLSVSPDIHPLRLPNVLKKFRFSNRSFHILMISVLLKRKLVTRKRNKTM